MTAVVATRSPVGIRPRLLAGLAAEGPTGLVEHEVIFGPLPLGWRPSRLIDTGDRSGLDGRAGPAFPTGRKHRPAPDSRRTPQVETKRAEGEPPIAKHRYLQTWTPHHAV